MMVIVVGNNSLPRDGFTDFSPRSDGQGTSQTSGDPGLTQCHRESGTLGAGEHRQGAGRGRGRGGSCGRGAGHGRGRGAGHGGREAGCGGWGAGRGGRGAGCGHRQGACRGRGQGADHVTPEDDNPAWKWRDTFNDDSTCLLLHNLMRKLDHPLQQKALIHRLTSSNFPLPTT